MANIYDKSSLVLIPSGTKTGKVFSQKPVSGDGDFTFTRASAATRVNADGNIEKETGNLLLQSNQFDTTWTSVNSGSVTGGQSGYDASSDAWLLTKAATNFSGIRQSISISGVHTFSVIAKAGTLNFLWVEEYIGASIYFDLINGTTSGSGEIASSMTSLGGGWWRCELSSASAITLVTLYPQATGSPSATAGNIYIQDAQLEQGLVARDYQETTTAAVYGGITDNTPRLDYTDSSCPALLLEPLRSNVIAQSEYFGDWTNNNSATLEANNLSSPQGVNNAYKFTTNAISAGVFKASSTLTSGQKYTYSVFLKHISGTEPLVRLRLQSGAFTTQAGIIANIQNGTIDSTIGSVTSDIQDYGNGWYRVIFTGTADSTNTANFTIYSYTANSFEWGVYGAQLEAGSYATSYIPTYGSSVSRVADSCSKTGISSLIGQTEGTLFVDMDSQTNGGNQTIARLQGGTAYVIIFTNTSGNIYALTSTGGLTLLQSGIENQRLKISISYKANDYIAYVNGVQKTIASSASTFTDLSEIYINRNNSGGEIGNENLNQLALFKERLTNAELATLTTI